MSLLIVDFVLPPFSLEFSTASSTIEVKIVGKIDQLGTSRQRIDTLNSDIKGHGLPSVGLLKRDGEYYVKFMLDGQVTRETTLSTRGKTVSWNDSIFL